MAASFRRTLFALLLIGALVLDVQGLKEMEVDSLSDLTMNTGLEEGQLREHEALLSAEDFGASSVLNASASNGNRNMTMAETAAQNRAGLASFISPQLAGAEQEACLASHSTGACSTEEMNREAEVNPINDDSQQSRPKEPQATIETPTATALAPDVDKPANKFEEISDVSAYSSSVIAAENDKDESSLTPVQSAASSETLTPQSDSMQVPTEKPSSEESAKSHSVNEPAKKEQVTPASNEDTAPPPSKKVMTSQELIEKPQEPRGQPQELREQLQEPREQPQEPREQPQEPREEPQEPREKPQEPREQPQEPREKPQEPREQPQEPREKPQEPREKPQEPREKPQEPREKPPTPPPTPPPVEQKPEGKSKSCGPSRFNRKVEREVKRVFKQIGKLFRF